MEITGGMIYYYNICKRKLWYSCHSLKMENNNDNVLLGKLLDEQSYKREDKHININNVINIDFIRERNVLHEVKKSKKIENASIYQTKYYLYYLKQRGVEGLRGEIDYPLLKKTTKVELTKEDEAKIEKMCAEIENIASTDVPPKFEKKNICGSCAYYDLCGV